MRESPAPCPAAIKTPHRAAGSGKSSRASPATSGRYVAPRRTSSPAAPRYPHRAARFADHSEVRRHKARFVLEFVTRAVGCDQAKDVAAVGCGHIDGIELGQFRRRERRRIRLEQRRRCHQHLFRAPERTRNDSRIDRWFRTHAQSDVNGIFEQIDHAIRHAQDDANLGVSMQKVRHYL